MKVKGKYVMRKSADERKPGWEILKYGFDFLPVSVKFFFTKDAAQKYWMTICGGLN